MTTVVPIQLDDGTLLYIEAQDDVGAAAIAPPIAEEPNEEQPRGGSKGLADIKKALQPNPAQSMRLVQSTIRTYSLYCLNAFKNFGAANVDEVTLEFGVNISADAGIPYIAGGKAQSNLKITVKCSYNKPTPGETEIVPNGQAATSNGQAVLSS